MSSGALCEASAADSVFARGRLVYRECGVERRARLISHGASHPDFHPAARPACYSADLEFVVDSLGKPEMQTARLVRASDRAFGEAELATVIGWLYEPALRHGRPVRQIVTEHEIITTAVVVVPKGSGPPTSPPSNQPRC